MSIFKSIGTKIKRVVSLKNVMNAVTGNYVGIGQDILRVASTQAPQKGGQAVASQEQTIQVSDIPAPVQQMLQSVGKTQSAKLSAKIAATPLVQDNIDGANSFALKVWWDGMWIKYKTYILALGGLIVALIGWKLLTKNKTTARRGRR